jgi:ornithine carbamoyltransferase
MNEETKSRKQLGAVEIWSESPDGQTRTKLNMTLPENLKSSDAIVRWIRQNAEIDGVYAVQRTNVRVKITKTEIVATDAEVL